MVSTMQGTWTEPHNSVGKTDITVKRGTAQNWTFLNKIMGEKDIQ